MAVDNFLKVNAELYKAMLSKDDEKVIELCESERVPKGGLHILTIHGDTVLHIATYHKKNNLVLKLLSKVSSCDNHSLTWQNNGGNTILHMTATNNVTVQAAVEMLRRAPMLLSMKNKKGEIPLFYAARHGKTKSYQYLHDEVNRTLRTRPEDWKTFLWKDDRSSILHASVMCGNYWIAHDIATKHEHLIDAKDGDEMTPLQLLSCNLPDFEVKNPFKRKIYQFVGSDIEHTKKHSMFKSIRKLNHSREWAMKLIKLLVERDTSWALTELRASKFRAKIHEYGRSSISSVQEQMLSSKTSSEDSITTHGGIYMPDTPLLLATKNGCSEIVEEILRVYPQAVEHIDEDGRNILHVAILYRRTKIINMLIDMDELEDVEDRLVGKVDNLGNTLLHMVGQKENRLDDELKSPAVLLQEEVLLYQRVKKISPKLDRMLLNNRGKTPEEVFAENNAELRNQAKEWMSETSKNCTVVAVLIATVAFAAAYTVPGGYEAGRPILRNKPLFLIFTTADALSLASALTSVIVFLNIATSPFRLKEFESSLLLMLWLGHALLVLSVGAMMVAFAVTIILTISSGTKWTNLTLYVVSFFPVLVFLFSNLRLYQEFFVALYRAFKFMNLAVHIPSCIPKPAVSPSDTNSRHLATHATV